MISLRTCNKTGRSELPLVTQGTAADVHTSFRISSVFSFLLFVLLSVHFLVRCTLLFTKSCGKLLLLVPLGSTWFDICHHAAAPA